MHISVRTTAPAILFRAPGILGRMIASMPSTRHQRARRLRAMAKG